MLPFHQFLHIQFKSAQRTKKKSMAHPKPASPNEPKTADNEVNPTAAEAKVVAAESPAETSIEAAVAAAAASQAVESPPASAKLDGTINTKTTDQEPTYFTTRFSSTFATARTLLNAGQFEDALTLIEAAITATRQVIGDDDELHESLAPLHYLYGTTLLYSVEESDDMVNGSAAAAQGAGGGPAANEEMAEDLQIAWENLDLARTIMEARGLVGEQEMALATSSAASDKGVKDADKKDAIENARTLLLDLSQIHLRLADLQKANSSYKECLADYAKALELRQAVLGPYDRKVADVHYQLGVVCMTRAAEGGGASDEVSGGVSGNATNGTAAAAAGASSGLLPPGAEDGIVGMMAAAASEAAAEAEAETKPTPAECHELRERSVQHYLACAQCFGGCIAKLCGVTNDKEIEDVVGKIQAVEGTAGMVDEGDKKMPAVEEGKKMGGTDEQEADEKHEHQTYADASQTLAGIRAKCAELANTKKPASSTTTDEDMEVVADLLSLLDELQETIDSQEEDLAGVHEVQEMKTKIEEEVKAADANPFGTAGAGAVGADGSVTTIGFGQPTASASATSATSTMAAAASGTSTGEAARPMMVVKKKKKRAALAPAPAADGSGAAAPASAEAAKPAAPAEAEPDAKRAKTE